MSVNEFDNSKPQRVAQIVVRFAQQFLIIGTGRSA